LIKKEQMNLSLPKRAALAAVAASTLLAAGCASVAVSNDAIEQNTAQALGLAKGSFTISDRMDDGVKSSYSVKTNTGKQYSCYVTGGVGITGRVVSDAMCNELGKPAKSAGATTGAAGQQCNALLKAAGKC
jgi:uncharacterized membrane protein